MIAFFLRELHDTLRQGPLLMAAVANAAALSLFILTWGDGVGVPPLAAMGFHGQVRLTEILFLTLLLPWTAVRCLPPERSNTLVRLGAAMARRPREVMAARLLASAGGLGVVAASGIPALLLAQRMSALESLHIARDLALLVSLVIPAAAWGCWAAHRWNGAIAGWAVAAVCTGLTVGLAWGQLPPVAAAGLSTLVGAGVALGVVAGADGALRFLSDAQL